LKIDDKPVSEHDGRTSDEFRDYLLTLQKLNVDQSIYVERMPSHYRLAVSICSTLLGIKLVSKKEGDGYRVGRVK